MKQNQIRKFFRLLATLLGIIPAVTAVTSCDISAPVAYGPFFTNPPAPSYGMLVPDVPVVLGSSVLPSTELFNPQCIANEIDFQNWHNSDQNDTCEIDPKTGAFIASDSWGGSFGVSLGSFNSTESDCIEPFNMYGVTELECFVYSDATGTLTLTPEGHKEGSQDAVTVELPCHNFKVSIPHEFSPMNDTQIILDILCENTKPGDTVYIQDIKFKNTDGDYLRVEYN